ncbi:uncharacterized protein SAPINGB_P003400 [Magnusiomyces paraingens]|uniref:Uncharacterized protein n=1 Tax=Magnusiomyces paraingens TaxID=2606893 RepID=A0A5E8BP66_9ASCO|nr:uncharacterized protein SAPINGB_P003400 [Saprochaete ingens]VVT53093.1 unnamed protein product [Saprochaete ingens]
MIVKSVASALTMASIASCSMLDFGGIFKRATLPDSFYGTVSSSVAPYNGDLSVVASFFGNSDSATATTTGAAQTTSKGTIVTISSQVPTPSSSSSTIIWWTPETTSTPTSTSSIVWWTPESASTSTSSVVNLWTQSSNAQTTSSSQSSSVSVAPYTANLTQFYLDYFSSRYYYVNQYATFFQTHVFSEIGTESAKLSGFLTYTDSSYTTLLSSDPQLTSALSNAATQFPWYTQWYQAQYLAYEATATAVSSQSSSITSSSSAGVSFGGSLEKDKMRVLTLQIGAIIAALVYLFIF